MPGLCQFNKQWLNNVKYSGWLAQDQHIRKAKCTLCEKIIDIGNMGESALESHMKGLKHRKLSEKIKKESGSAKITDFVKLSGKSGASNSIDLSESGKSSTDSSSTPTNISSFVSANETLTAEVLWCFFFCSIYIFFPPLA